MITKLWGLAPVRTLNDGYMGVSIVMYRDNDDTEPIEVRLDEEGVLDTALYLMDSLAKIRASKKAAARRDHDARQVALGAKPGAAKRRTA